MKVADIRRKLSAALVALGMLSPAALHAANLNTNLIVNGGFEDLDFAGPISTEGAPAALDWAGVGFTYSHDGSSGLLDYANGTEPPASGSYYFTPGGAEPGGGRHESYATAITQNIDVSGGPSGSLIATGNAKFNLSAYFNSYSTQTDHGIVQVDFLNASSSLLGSGSVTPGPVNLNEWTQFLTTGPIPVGTATVKVSAWGVLLAGGSSDGYMDNLDFQVSNDLPALSIDVNRLTGAVTLANLTGSAHNISSYSISSDFGALATSNWLSIADNYDSGNPGPSQIDPAHAWAEQTVTSGEVAEADPSTAGTSLANRRTVNLGALWIRNPNEDLQFQYASGGQTVTGIVNYVGGSTFSQGDLNVDGAINAADWTIFRTNQHANLADKSPAEAYQLGDLNEDLQNNYQDFVLFKDLYDAANGVGAFAAMAAAVPEPSSVVLCLGVGLLAVVGRRSAARSYGSTGA